MILILNDTAPTSLSVNGAVKYDGSLPISEEKLVQEIQSIMEEWRDF